mgnify:CR=1 FL=1
MRSHDPHATACGSQVRRGIRQSMPSSSIANCAGVSATVPVDEQADLYRLRSLVDGGVRLLKNGNNLFRHSP